MTVRIAFAGDIHGSIDLLLLRVADFGVDAVVQVGDFETVRDEADLRALTGPMKYRKLGDFGSYLRGEQRTPVPIHFIGGNHEVYRGFLELHPQGGEVAPGIHYLGRYGVGTVAGVPMAWLSGIYNGAVYDESYPQPGRARGMPLRRYTYYHREDVQALGRAIQKRGRLRVLLLHDWPRHLERHATAPLRRELEPEHHCLETYELICAQRPEHVFCGHMHWPLSARCDSTRIECLAHIESEGSVQVVEFDV